MKSKGMWKGWYLSTIFSLIDFVLFPVAIHFLLCLVDSDPKAMQLGGELVIKHQWAMTHTAFLTCLVLDFVSWLWTVEKDKARLFYLALVINGIPVVTYGMLAYGISPILIDVHGRRLIIIRYLQWLFTTPAMLYLYSIMSAVPTREILASMTFGAAMIVFGFFANICPYPFDLINLALALACFYFVMVTLEKVIMLAIEATSFEDCTYRTALKTAGYFMIFTWVGVPLVWMLAYLHLISYSTEEVMYEIFDFGIKAGVSCIIMHTSIKTYSERQKEKLQLALVEERNRTIEALKESARMKENFFAAMSHELRTPLVGIIGLADGIIAGSCGDISSKVKDRLETMKLSGQRLCNLVNDILDAASLRNDSLRLVEDDVDLKETCTHVMVLTKAVLKKGVEFGFEMAKDVPEIRGDSRRIKQILHNLLGNAAKFTWTGFVKLKVEVDEHCRNVLLSVSDSGVGIEEANFDRIFGAFNQGNEGMARQFGGTGLGLTIANDLAKAHGGQIFVSSKLGVGSTFVLRLPIKKGSEMANSFSSHCHLKEIENGREGPVHVAVPDWHAEALGDVVNTPADTKATKEFLAHSEFNQGSIEVLSVDDDPVNQVVIEDLLLPEGYIVTRAMDGDDALSLLRQRGYLPDIVLLDTQMPGKHGYEVCTELRKLYPESLPIVIVSANTDEDNILRGFKSGSNDFIKKPFSRAEVLARIQTQLKLRDLWLKDVQDSKRKYNVLQELQTFIDTANAPIFGIDSNGLVNEWNNKSAAITGYSREEVFGRDLVKEFITKEYQESVREVLDNALRGQETANFEFPMYTKSQHRVEILLNATSRRDTSAKVVGVIGVGQDITERKQIEMEKSRVAQELQTFIEMANAPIFGIDAHGLVNEWNKKSAEITGFSQSEVIGKDLVEVYITEEFRSSVREVLDNALRGVEKSNFEFPLFTKDKRRVEVLLNATTRRDVNGTIVGVIGVGQDITDMRRLMEQEALLVHAQAANDAKSRFLATMSHEMRTPLNVIMGMNELVMDSTLTDEQRSFTQQISASSEALLLLINDILDLTKVESGKLELTSVEFDLRRVMEDTVDAVAGRAMVRGLEVFCYMDPTIESTVIGDPDRLRQILLNLLSNGVKFTQAGEVYVVAEVLAMTSAEVTFRFKVHDSGIGVSAEDQKKLFNRFSQVDSSTTRTYGGSGLGLAISKQFAELMHGSMGVQSEAGRGSVFWFTAEFKHALASATEPLPPPPPIRQCTSCLLVARNESLRVHLVRYLEAFGQRPATAATVGEAAAILDAGRFDLLVVVVDAVPVAAPGTADSSGSLAGCAPAPAVERALLAAVEGLKTLLGQHMDLRSVVLCPMLLLNRFVACKEAYGSLLLARPVALPAFHRALTEAVASASGAGGGDVSCLRRSGSAASSLPPDATTPMESAATAGGWRPEGTASGKERVLAVDSTAGPRLAECKPKTPKQAKVCTIGNAEQNGEGRERVLVVDDNAGQRRVLQLMLAREGFAVDVVADGAAAVEATARVAYVAVLMDGIMPVMTGWDAARRIRQREEAMAPSESAGGVVIIGVSGQSDAEEVQRFLDSGMTDVISKPVDRALVASKIRHWLDHRSSSLPPQSAEIVASFQSQPPCVAATDAAACQNSNHVVTETIAAQESEIHLHLGNVSGAENLVADSHHSSAGIAETGTANLVAGGHVEVDVVACDGGALVAGGRSRTEPRGPRPEKVPCGGNKGSTVGGDHAGGAAVAKILIVEGNAVATWDLRLRGATVML